MMGLIVEELRTIHVLPLIVKFDNLVFLDELLITSNARQRKRTNAVTSYNPIVIRNNSDG